MNLGNVTCTSAPLPPSNAQNSGLNSEANGTDTDGKQKPVKLSSTLLLIHLECVSCAYGSENISRSQHHSGRTEGAHHAHDLQISLPTAHPRCLFVAEPSNPHRSSLLIAVHAYRTPDIVTLIVHNRRRFTAIINCSSGFRLTGEYFPRRIGNLPPRQVGIRDSIAGLNRYNVSTYHMHVCHKADYTFRASRYHTDTDSWISNRFIRRVAFVTPLSLLRSSDRGEQKLPHPIRYQ
jgi:hypothetical protein